MKKSHHPVIGLGVGLVIVIVAAIVQSWSGSPLSLPTPVWIAAFVPTGIGLITGGYLKNFKSPLLSADIESLPEMSPSQTPSAPEPKPADWTSARAAEYARIDGYMLTHVYRPSKLHGQMFDIFIFLVRHRKGTDTPPRKHFDEIEKAEFFLGESWGSQVFSVKNTGAVIGVRTHAWGTFLATCRITFRGQTREPIILHRYVDFQMLQDTPVET
jgi:hypothetical protein